jgi:hyperosmotically inducible periplasmic protein
MRTSNKALKLTAVTAFVLSMGASSIAFAENAGQYVDDATITTKVKAALLSDSQLKATKVSVQTTQGTVQLTGAVGSKSQESEAVRVANQVNGVKTVTDQLTVDTTESE